MVTVTVTLMISTVMMVKAAKLGAALPLHYASATDVALS